MARLMGETHNGRTVSFSHEAYADAMRRYDLKDIEAVAIRTEVEARERSGITDFLEKLGVTRVKSEKVPEEVANFFRDFAIIQEADHPDYDRGIGIGSLATRIELASGQVTAQELKKQGIDLKADCAEYDLAFR